MKVCVCLLLIPIFGWLRIASEEKLIATQRAANLRPPASSLTLSEQLGQGLYATVLGGFRGILASWMNIQSVVDFDRNDFPSLNQRYRLITRLQPQVEEYWITWSHHMGYNAASSAQRKTELPLILRKQNTSNYVNIGISVLHEGIRHLPASWQLPLALADIYNGYNGRLKDPRKSAAAYQMAWDKYQNSGATANRHFILRNVGYQLSMLKDVESQAKAFHILRNRFLAGDRMPSVLRDLRKLQARPFILPGQHLTLPPEEAPSPADLLTPEGARKSFMAPSTDRPKD